MNQLMGQMKSMMNTIKQQQHFYGGSTAWGHAGAAQASSGSAKGKARKDAGKGIKNAAREVKREGASDVPESEVDGEPKKKKKRIDGPSEPLNDEEMGTVLSYLSNSGGVASVAIIGGKLKINK